MTELRAGTVVVRENHEIKVEMTDNGNIKLIDEAKETFIFINLSDQEVDDIAVKIFALYRLKKSEKT